MDPSEARRQHENILSQLSESIPDGVATWEVLGKALDDMSVLVMEMINDMEVE